MKIGRNAPCPCGSGKKYKKCCGDPLRPQQMTRPKGQPTPEQFRQAIQRRDAEELMRQQQQGLGKPIISADMAGYRMVAVGNELRYSKDWKVFPDFLAAYLKDILGEAWGKLELGKPLAERHPIMQWYHVLCEVQKAHFDTSKTVQSMPNVGVLTCFYSLAYNLYLLKHNIELQERLLRRLRDPKQFQGAYYELMIANCLIRSGFRLELEDEADDQSKHCEFSATSHVTGKKFWVEAKMRSVIGVLGKTKVDGSTGKDPTERIATHLRDALSKPAADDRLIFIDVNAPSSGAVEQPIWLPRAIRRLDDRERNTPPETNAYVFITNLCFHHHLREQTSHEALAYGLNIADFGKVRETTLPEMYRAKQRHLDAHRVMDSFRSYPSLPSTFDGKLVSESLGGRPPLKIGETYQFVAAKDGQDIVGEVTTATVLEVESEVWIGVKTSEGTSSILKEKMSPEQLAEYQQHKDTYFGRILPAGRKTDSPFELFEWMVESYSKTSKERLVELCKGAPDADALAKLDRDDLVLALCDRWTLSSIESAG